MIVGNNKTIVPLVELHNSGELFVRINQDGTIEYGKGYNPKQGAKLFWETVAKAKVLQEGEDKGMRLG